MQTQQIFLFFIGIVALVGLVAFFSGRSKAQRVRASGAEMYAQPDQYGWFTAISSAGPALLVGLAAVVAIATADIDIEGMQLLIASLVVAAVGLVIGLALVKPDFHARNAIETLIRYVLIGAAMISIVTTFGILVSIIFEAIRFFQMESFWTFITGTTWDPGNSFQMAAGRGEGVESTANFGAVPLFAGTFMITLIAMLVAEETLERIIHKQTFMLAQSAEVHVARIRDWRESRPVVI